MPAARGWCCCLPGAADEPKVLVIGLQGSGKTLLVQQLLATAAQLQQKQSSSPVSSKHRLRLCSAAVAPLPCSDSSSYAAAQSVPAGPPPRTLPTIGTELQQCPLGFTFREVGGVMRQLWHHYYAEASALLFVVDAALPDPSAAAAVAAAVAAPSIPPTVTAAAAAEQAAADCSCVAAAGSADAAQHAANTKAAAVELPAEPPAAAAAAITPLTNISAGQLGLHDTTAGEPVPDDVLSPAAAHTSTAAAVTDAAADAGRQEAASAGVSTATNSSASRLVADATSSSTSTHAEQLQQPSDSTSLPGAVAATEQLAFAAVAAAAAAETEDPGNSSVLSTPGCVTVQNSTEDSPQSAAAAVPAANAEQQQTHVQTCGTAVFGCQRSKRPAVPLAEVLRSVVGHADLQGKPMCIVMNKTDMLGSGDRDKQLAELSETLLAACCSNQQAQHDSSSQVHEGAAVQKQQQKQQKQQQHQQQKQQKQQPNSPRGCGVKVLQTSAMSGTDVQALLQWLSCNSL